MSLTVEITERTLSPERQAVLSDLLVRTAGMDPDEAAMTALVMPCAIGPMPDAEAQRSLLAALQGAGFSARGGYGEADDAPATYQAPPAYPAPAPPPPYPTPAYPPPPGPYAPPAANPYAPTPAPKASNNTAIIAVAAVLGVAVIALAAVLLLRDKDAPADTTVVTTAPPGQAGTATGGGAMEGMADSMESMDGYVEPVQSDGADYALGYSPNQGVNWGLFSQGSQTRYAAAPNGTPIPVRDAPSGRHGNAVTTVPAGGSVSTDGCLPPRPEDGARWCRTDYAGGEGWVYDRYLRASAPAPSPPSGGSGGVQTARLNDGQLTMTVSDGGRTYRIPRPLSPSTSVSNIQQKTLAGHRVVQFIASDARWTTTYYWEYRAGLLHFVGTDGDRTNVSEAAGSQAIIRADQGYVPGDDVVRGNSNASSTPTPSTPPRRSGSSDATLRVPNVIVMGSYGPSDQAGLQRRLALARQTGLTLQVVPASNYDMGGDFQVIVAGPFDGSEILQRLQEVRRYVPDAFRKALD